MALDRPLRIDLPRDPAADTVDAGHLAIQELVLRLARAAGIRRAVELPTRPAEPWRSADVGLRDDRWRVLLLVECWNTIGDIGAGARSTNRKVADLNALAVTMGDDPYRVAACWVVRATRANRALVARYPEVFAARFPGSSAGWVRALTGLGDPPRDPGLVWAAIDGSRVYAWRQTEHDRGRTAGGETAGRRIEHLPPARRAAAPGRRRVDAV